MSQRGSVMTAPVSVTRPFHEHLSYSTTGFATLKWSLPIVVSSQLNSVHRELAMRSSALRGHQSSTQVMSILELCDMRRMSSAVTAHATEHVCDSLASSHCGRSPSCDGDGKEPPGGIGLGKLGQGGCSFGLLRGDGGLGILAAGDSDTGGLDCRGGAATAGDWNTPGDGATLLGDGNMVGDGKAPGELVTGGDRGIGGGLALVVASDPFQ